jgi:hypothetical protein
MLWNASYVWVLRWPGWFDQVANLPGRLPLVLSSHGEFSSRYILKQQLLTAFIYT